MIPRSCWLFALGLAACTEKRPPAVVEAPIPVVTTSSTSAFVVARGGTDPALKTRDAALWIFVSPGGGEERRLAGVALGDARGPRYGLLSGVFTPLVAPPFSDRAYEVTVSADGRAHVAFAKDLDVVIDPPRDGRVRVVIRGDAVVLPRADRTEVRALAEGHPSAALAVTAGEAPSLVAPRADTLEITPRERGTMSIATPCRPQIVRPVPRGATSVFVVHVGSGSRAASDVLYGLTEGERPRIEACPLGTVTSTLSVPWPPEA
ncbi:hypothetical protein L6R52_33275 [Myxococcota bacterium]|nr:hypothetical protein [Myxococcota bacterium]